MMQKIQQVTTQLGILSQLFTTRMNQLLGEHDLNLSQFGMLTHLARHNQPHTFSDLTAALELNQPAVSKIVNKLSKADLVAVARDQTDSRKKWVSLTQSGGQRINAVMQQLGPDVASWFASWSAEELHQFDQLLQKLNYWFDDNRLK